MDLSNWLSLFSICLLGAMSPGPSLAVMLNTTLAGGHRSGYTAAVSHGVGVGLYGLLTVTGLAVLITRSPAVFMAVQLLGGIYLIYLGIKSLRSAGHSTLSIPDSASSHKSAALDGFMIAFLNPKLAVFMLALFAQFLEPGADAMTRVIMVATVGITDAIWYCLVVALISRQRLLEKLRSSAGLIDRVFGIVLIALALTVLLRALPEG
jgi:threonine efflux protein